MSDPHKQVSPSAPARRGPAPALFIFLLFPLLGLVAAVAMTLANSGQPPAPPTPAPVTVPPLATRPQLSGQPAPDFSAPTLEQTTTALSDYRGRIVFLNFWATWCGPCERELPAFQAFMERQPEDGPVVLAVNIGETYDQVNAFLSEREISGFPVLLDPYYEIAERYGVSPIPVTFVIDEAGVIRFSKFGEITPDDMRDYLEMLRG
ncbi:MAG: TlpA disulfide reductase family protein [Chloroflexota bacterium]|nr:MAG: hypothetical protein DIU68_08440 [Chloroflexota bacterium]